MLKKIEQEFSRKLLLESEQAEYFLEFNVEAFLRGDSAARGSFYQVEYNTSSITPNEIRSSENRNALPGGDELFVNATMTPLRFAVTKAEADALRAQADARRAVAMADKAELEVERLRTTPAPTPALPSPPVPDDSRSRIVESYRGVVLDAVKRIARKEQKAMTRAIDKAPADLEAWAKGFISEQEQYVGEVLSPVIRGFVVALGDEVDTDSLLRDVVMRHVGVLSTELAKPQELKGKLGDWELLAVQAGERELSRIGQA